MSGGFKWIECGDWQVIIDEAGRILAHVVVGFANQPKRMVAAFVQEKPIGNYLNADFARAAVEEEMSARRRVGIINSARPTVPPLPMDERAWIEDQYVP